jgi:serine kinase of HPr protein (carbohydrate metabolism regulator)
MAGKSSYESTAELRVAKCQLHGVLVQVCGTGVLLTGDSGVGKTACALELLRRGHPLVADDAVQIFPGEGALFGRAPEITRSLVDIRGVGIRDITELFDNGALRDESRIDVCIEIHRTNMPTTTRRMLGVPLFRIDAAPPRIMADQVEAIVKERSGNFVR